jgi:aspartate aminotransferase-like enzyme
MKQYLLFTPGPTPIPPAVISAMSKPIIHHRHEEFKELLKRVTEKLRYVFQTNNDIITLTGSGTAGMEAAVCNFFSAGDEVLVANSGKFGRRWTEIANIFGLKVHEITVRWGDVIEPDIVKKILSDNKNIKGVLLTHCETSTGVTHDIKNISEVVRLSSDALIVVDAISSLGGEELRMDDWGIDVVVSASQKGLMTPPGLAFISMSQRANGYLHKSNLPKYYLDIKKSKETLNNFLTSWTPATTLFVGLDAALDIIVKEKLETIWERNKVFSSYIRNNCVEMGFKMFSKKPSNIVTALRTPEGLNPTSLLKILKADFGIILAGGQEELKDQILRISNIGAISKDDIAQMIKSMREGIQKMTFSSKTT